LPKAGIIDEDRDYDLKLEILRKRGELLVNLLNGEEANLRRRLLVLRGGDGIFVERHPDPALRHGPREEGRECVAVPVAGLRSEASARHSSGDEGRDLSGRDVLEAIRVNERCFPPPVLARLWRTLPHLRGEFPARHFERVTDGAKDVSEVVDIGLTALRRLRGPYVLDVPGEDLGDGGL
jgi:hypothetical protein